MDSLKVAVDGSNFSRVHLYGHSQIHLTVVQYNFSCSIVAEIFSWIQPKVLFISGAIWQKSGWAEAGLFTVATEFGLLNVALLWPPLG